MAILGLLWHQAPHVGLGGEHVGDLGEEGGAHQQAKSVRLKRRNKNSTHGSDFITTH